MFSFIQIASVPTVFIERLEKCFLTLVKNLLATDVCAFMKSQFYTLTYLYILIQVSDYIVSSKFRKQNFSIFCLFQDYLDYNYVFFVSILS